MLVLCICQEPVLVTSPCAKLVASKKQESKVDTRVHLLLQPSPYIARHPGGHPEQHRNSCRPMHLLSMCLCMVPVIHSLLCSFLTGGSYSGTQLLRIAAASMLSKARRFRRSGSEPALFPVGPSLALLAVSLLGFPLFLNYYS